MVYIIRMKVDGGCRRNGYSDAVGAAAVVMEQRWGRSVTWTRGIPEYSDPTPTSQRAELEAIIFALELVLEKADELDTSPYVKVLIETDSKYVHGVMTDWSFKWRDNGWINSAGNPVANRDLIEKAVDLDAEVERNGEVKYGWIPRSENQAADTAVSDKLQEMDN